MHVGMRLLGGKGNEQSKETWDLGGWGQVVNVVVGVGPIGKAASEKT